MPGFENLSLTPGFLPLSFLSARVRDGSEPQSDTVGARIDQQVCVPVLHFGACHVRARAQAKGLCFLGTPTQWHRQGIYGACAYGLGP